MEKIWLKEYPPGIPEEINPDTYSSIVEMLEQSCEKFAYRPAFYSLGTMITFQQFEKASRHFAAYLQHELHLKKGDRIAIMLPNLLQYPIVMFGALRAGLIVVNVNPLYTVHELAYQLKDAWVETIVVVDNFAKTVEQALPATPLKNIIVTQIGDLLPRPKAWLIHTVLKYIRKKIPAWHIPHAIDFRQILLKNKMKHFQPVTIAPTDIAFLQYTGGTTGISKGAVLTHRNMIANEAQAEAWFKPLFTPGQEIIITALPLYHIFSLLANCLFISKIGGLNVFIANPRDIPTLIKEMKKFKFTAITGVNTLFNGLLKNPHFAKLDFSALKLSLGGGMAVQQIVAEKWQEVTHCPLLEAYGLTETSPAVAVNPINIKTYNGSVGLPLPSTLVTILDEYGKELPMGQSGELGVKGPQVMDGYWKNPAETAKVFTRDGWLLTGDIASIDDKGFVHILERKKDMILVSGFNVYPNEVEDVLVKMPGIVEAAVIGIPDEHSGEIVKAFIVKSDPKLTAEDIIQYCYHELTPYKVPKAIEFCKELPKTNVGKILRRALRTQPYRDTISPI